MTARLRFHDAVNRADSLDFSAYGGGAAGKVTAIQFHSGWCPICVMQERGVRDMREAQPLDQRALAQGARAAKAHRGRRDGRHERAG